MLKNNGVLEFEVNILKDAISQYVERKQKGNSFCLLEEWQFAFILIYINIYNMNE